jgi:hypothetical protein
MLLSSFRRARRCRFSECAGRMVVCLEEGAARQGRSLAVLYVLHGDLSCRAA